MHILCLMSPQTKKNWQDSTIYLKRLGITVLCFFSSWGFYSAVDYIKGINHNVEILLKNEAVNDSEKKQQLEFNARVQNAVNHNAGIIEHHTTDIIRIKAKLGIE